MVWMIFGRCFLSCYSRWRYKRDQKRWERIKLNNLRKAKGLPPVYTFCERIGESIQSLFRPCTTQVKAWFCPCCLEQGDKRRWSFFGRIWINGTKENHIVKCISGFTVGIMFSILLWETAHADATMLGTKIKFDIFHPKRDRSIVTKVILIVIGTLLTTFLTLSEACRCVFTLVALQLFTNKGRVMLLAYCLILTLSGPAKNIATNLEILTESLACGQNLLKDSVLDLFNFVTKPFSSFERAIGHVVSSIQGVFERMKEELESIVSSVQNTVVVIKNAYASLGQTIDLCNAQFGSPHDKCMQSFDSALTSCQDGITGALSWMCSSVTAFDFVCTFAKATDAICWLPGLIQEYLFEPIVQHFKDFAKTFETFFDARLNITYKLDHQITGDKPLSDVYKGMKTEIVSHVSWIFEYISFMDLTLLAPLLFVLFKAINYRRKFLNSDAYDNFYISDSLIQIDTRRYIAGGESIFPLRYRETKQFVEITESNETLSWALVKEERRQRKLSVLLVFIASVQILSYLLIDYILYQFMEWVRLNAAAQFQKWNDPLLGFTATVEGEGFLASMYRSILENLNPLNFVLPSLDSTKCLPDADMPDYGKYLIIGLLLLVCFLLAIFEPYGLRLRHLVCGWIYPHRVQHRERWLYMHILTNRDTFLDIAIKTVRDKIGFMQRAHWRNDGGKTKSFRVSCKDKLVHRFPILENCFESTGVKCFICGAKGDHDDREAFTNCFECNTVYCMECLMDLNDKCVICNKGMDSQSEYSTMSTDDENVESFDLENYDDHENQEKMSLLH